MPGFLVRLQGDYLSLWIGRGDSSKFISAVSEKLRFADKVSRRIRTYRRTVDSPTSQTCSSIFVGCRDESLHCTHEMRWRRSRVSPPGFPVTISPLLLLPCVAPGSRPSQPYHRIGRVCRQASRAIMGQLSRGAIPRRPHVALGGIWKHRRHIT